VNKENADTEYSNILVRRLIEKEYSIWWNDIRRV